MKWMFRYAARGLFALVCTAGSWAENVTLVFLSWDIGSIDRECVSG
jgi:hypothetical protein